jgi:transposase
MSTKIIESRDIRFQPYAQDILIDLPVRIEELVKDNVLAQIINKVVEGIAIKDMECYYSGIGRPPYHPRMLIKVWIYGYCTKVYTSRPLAKKLRQDLVFMWLAGGQRPCFKTLSEFRSCRMQDLVDTVLSEVLLYLVEQGYVDLSDLYVDGSKWAANGNKHKIIWRKNTERYKAGVLARITDLLEEAKQLQQQEDNAYGNKDLAEHQSEEQIQLVLNSKDLESQLYDLHKIIEEQGDKKRKHSLERVHRHLTKEQVKLDKYETQQSVLAGRNSYSKTDEDATALRMKDDQLLPGYNVQITTSDQFIVNATIHQSASDSPTLPPHVQQLEQRLSGITGPDWRMDYTADAGYGSEENYTLLADKGHTAYVKYPLWYQEITGKLEKRLFNAYNWYYDPQQDYYQCPNDKKLLFKEEITKTTANGYDRLIRIYESQGCAECPLFEKCRSPRAKPGSNRKVWRSKKLETFKKEVKQRLACDKGLEKRSQRSVDVETPFANIKHNMAHRRFILRGIDKVNIEFQFLAIAHNLKKVYCDKTGIWEDYYAQRAARSTSRRKKRA